MFVELTTVGDKFNAGPQLINLDWVRKIERDPKNSGAAQLVIEGYGEFAGRMFIVPVAERYEDLKLILSLAGVLATAR